MLNSLIFSATVSAKTKDAAVVERNEWAGGVLVTHLPGHGRVTTANQQVAAAALRCVLFHTSEAPESRRRRQCDEGRLLTRRRRRRRCCGISRVVPTLICVDRHDPDTAGDCINGYRRLPAR